MRGNIKSSYMPYSIRPVHYPNVPVLAVFLLRTAEVFFLLINLVNKYVLLSPLFLLVFLHFLSLLVWFSGNLIINSVVSSSSYSWSMSKKKFQVYFVAQIENF